MDLGSSPARETLARLVSSQDIIINLNDLPRDCLAIKTTDPVTPARPRSKAQDLSEFLSQLHHVRTTNVASLRVANDVADVSYVGGNYGQIAGHRLLNHIG